MPTAKKKKTRKRTSTAQQKKKLATIRSAKEEREHKAQLERVLEIQRAIANTMQEIMVPRPESVEVEPRGKYDALMHAKLIRCKLLGFNNASTARACGVDEVTIRDWLQTRPQLAADFDQAEMLVGVNAAGVMAQLLLSDDDRVRFNAAKFILERRTEEFRDDAKPTVQVSFGDIASAIRRDIYGIEEAPLKQIEARDVSDATPAAAATEAADHEFINSL